MNQNNMPKVADRQNFMEDASHHRHQSLNVGGYDRKGQNNTIEETEMDDDTTFTRNDLQDSELKASYARPKDQRLKQVASKHYYQHLDVRN